jgi:hypothetical protein
MFLALSVLLFLIQSSPNLPDYHSEARLQYSHVCNDGSTTRHFVQNGEVNYYLVSETTTSSVVLIRLVRVVDRYKIDSTNYFIKSLEGEVRRVESTEWFASLSTKAPKYFLLMKGEDEKCRIVYPKR